MKESPNFRSIHSEIEIKKARSGTKPLTEGEYNEGQNPMQLKEYWLSFRGSVQKHTLEEATPEDVERIKKLNELVSPKLEAEYKEILKEFGNKNKISAEHPQREFVDINEGKISARIETWIAELVKEINSKKEPRLTTQETAELYAQAWFLFDSIGTVLNTKSLESDIKDYNKKNPLEESDEEKQKLQKKELVKELQTRYPLSKDEIEILLNLVTARKNPGEEYSPKVLMSTISRLWKDYRLHERNGKIAKLSLGYLVSKGAESFAPYLYQNLMVEGKFHSEVFLESFGLERLSSFSGVKMDIELTKMMNEVNHQVNERIVNSIFYQEFEFIHEKSLGEVFATLERGKNATEHIIRDVISQFTPMLTGIAMSAAFIAKINPLLGAINVASMPAMYNIAKKQNKKVTELYENEKRQGEKISTNLEQSKRGIEEIKTSSESLLAAENVRVHLDKQDTLSATTRIERMKMYIKRMIPFDITTVIAATVGGYMAQEGMIAPGAVLSNIQYSHQLNRPIQDLVLMYFDDFARYVQDIQRMEEVFGAYEKLDLPEGEREKNRISVSQLKDHAISIKNLSYKNILKNVDLDIKQGEFLAISGPSGAGKSTLLRNIVGLYKPTSGAVEIGGVENQDIKKYGNESLYSLMSYSNQNPQIFEGMTFRDNLKLWSKNDVSDEKIKKVLSDLHLEKFAHRLDEEIKHFSGGEKVRIGLARTLIKGAKIMLLDEPTASLDSRAANEVRIIVKEINQKYPDTTIICVSHDDELINMSTRSIKMAEFKK